MRYKAVNIGLDEPVVIPTFSHLNDEELHQMFAEALESEEYELCSELQAEANSRGFRLSNNNNRI